MEPLSPLPPHLGPSLGPSPVVPPLTLAPLSRPPSSGPPSQPSRPPLSPPAGYVRSVHACPAAYPRMYEGTFSRESYPFSPIPEDESKKARAARIEKDKITCAESARAAAKNEGSGWKTNHGDGLWLSVERWKRENPVEGGATLVMLHANGMLKEDYHPLLVSLFASSPNAQFGNRAPLPGGVAVVNDVFLLEDTLHGASVDLNAGKLPSLHSWGDLARDLQNFLRYCMPGLDENPGWALEWKERAPRKVFAVGHSFGGNASVQAAAASPELFEGLFLIEPMTNPTGANNSPARHYFIQGLTLKRRDTWPSVEAAQANRSNPMFSKFPDATFGLWLSHGLVPTRTGEVTLATPPWCEAVVFSDCHSPQRGWDLLPTLKMPVGFVTAEDASWIGGAEIAAEITSRPPRARNERTRAGHVAVQEDPVGVGEALGRYLATIRAGVWDATGSRL
ncbi:uncharacterized protein CcaverHIS019_0606840 [Cutaneotrichosporon cavernicola]|uniref:AB hydrolase-1 domain-containing protein n=1 Tax=Cutaneotrichosporon cavernicola TaxID=279322 RepID=A0AA48L968_9TREE|nr:uncharacterized protein CcaverHIS019_0606840 [Cutaneotrichosporon cavernicola]BEI94225.1 hypothetical protein CcaverHIS019_0606840 [Cutaneotrichosporon cavernicola]BEJ02005.1 hypothetical protein CcaverHIS631_0606870 [Cutaneotrichosporon cavernicola]BEJ09768.1 hypothetical protein CcaverHIS641_0606830 [Cutaneotrichosporon cavernicola]